VPLQRARDGDEVKIANGIINLFHALPNNPNVQPPLTSYVERLVALVMQLEMTLMREIASPYRESLTRFLNTIAPFSINYFLERITEPSHNKMFRGILKESIAAPLRNAIAADPHLLMQYTLNVAAASASTESAAPPAVAPIIEAQFQGLRVLSILVKRMPELLTRTEWTPVVERLRQLWQSPERLSRAHNEEHVSLAHTRESKLFVKLFLSYALQSRERSYDLLFDMLSVFTTRTYIDFSFLRDFYAVEVCERYLPSQKNAIMRRFLTFFVNPQVQQDHKVQVLQVMISPMLSEVFAKHENDNHEVLDTEVWYY
jgi:transformation/transcription domain-associated protein